MEDDDKTLVLRSRSADMAAYSELVRRYQGNVRACIAVRLTGKHEAEDLAQEAFIIAYRKLEDFDADRSFGAWVRSIAFNLLRNYWRKYRPSAVGGAEELEALVDEHIGIVYSDRHESDTMGALRHCMERLDEDAKKLLAMHYTDEMSVAEIREKLGVKHSTMTMRLHRLRDQLKKCITEKEGSYPV
jgi:RNA polymerase sigma-70 factor (ECF subfamily)